VRQQLSAANFLCILAKMNKLPAFKTDSGENAEEGLLTNIPVYQMMPL